MDFFPLVKPLLHALPPEAAHRATLQALGLGLAGSGGAAPCPTLSSSLWGRTFANPIGLAAGFDKNAEAIDPLLRLGFGFVEVGGVTPRPQTGNPRPRVFRLPAQQAMINRLGLNNDGVEAAAQRLRRHQARSPRKDPSTKGPIGVNIAPNKGSEDPIADYALCAARLSGLCDFLTINVSSPNTPGLRGLQAGNSLRQVIDAVRSATGSVAAPPAVLVKIAPDLDGRARADIAAALIDSGADGLVVSNTTVSRPDGLPAHLAAEAGGLSGSPLKSLATDTLRAMTRLTSGRLPIIGVGGIASGADAYERIRAGASLLQLYTALIYQGPKLLQNIASELASRLAADGFDRLADAVGKDAGCEVEETGPQACPE